MAFELPPLPYAKDALAPHISANTLDFHYGKHHNAYVTNLNNLMADGDSRSLEEIMKDTAGDSSKAGVFNNAAQVWNHTFYWHSMKPGGGGKPSGAIAAKIDEDFGSYDKFVEEFKTAGATQFGSGWAWLVLDGGKLKVTKIYRNISGQPGELGFRERKPRQGINNSFSKQRRFPQEAPFFLGRR